MLGGYGGGPTEHGNFACSGGNTVLRGEPVPAATEKASVAIARLLRVAGHALAVLAVSSVLSNASSQDAPTIERSMALPFLGGTPPVAPAWSADGERLAFLWNGEGLGFRDIWVTDAGGSEPRRITNLAIGASPGAEATALQDTSLQRLLAGAQSRRVSGVSEILWDAASGGLYFAFEGDLHHVSVDSGDIRRMTTGGGRKSDLGLSPDGAYLSYLGDGDLWLWRFGDDALVKATNVGKPALPGASFGRFTGLDDEITSYAWSADSNYIAVHRTDRTRVNRMPIPSYIGRDEPFLAEVRRPYPGQDDAVKTLGIYSRAGGTVSELPLREPVHRNILNYEWSPTANRLLIEQETDEGEHRWLYVADIPNGQALLEPIYHDHRPRRIYSVFTSHWASSGQRIYFIDDNSGYYRIASLPASGGNPRMLTAGDYDVAGSSGGSRVTVARETQLLFFTAASPNPRERHVFTIGESGGSPRRVTSRPGVHEEFAVAPGGDAIAVVSSSDLEPAELYIVNVASPDTPVRVTHSPAPEFHRYDWIEPRYVQFPSRIDDYTLHARIIEPPNLDPSKRYPVILGNVYSNTVRNSWSTRGHPTPERISPFQQAMAMDGDYITIQVDLRGSIGYGVDFRETFQGDWGGADLEDLHSTVDYLNTLPYVDPDRIGIWGNSYGGMLVLFALFEKPGMFRAGVAGAPAIDVSKFTSNDQHLSRRPHTHPEIFRQSTLLNYGETLTDPVLLIHGLHDDIVPVQSTLQMYEKLLLLGKEPDIIIAPTSSHWWASDEHYAIYTFGKIREYFRRHVGDGAR